MATISTNTFLDDGTARTAGETWSIDSGAVLTIRTDTRWHSNSPASMTGSLGAISATNGGLTIEGRNVRWLAFNSGSGNVPAVGTTITQGGVSGYLLGVYASLTSAPTTVGSAVPSTGFIKFREVSGGNFSSGALSGIGASATGTDVQGWIEVALEGNVTMNYPGQGLLVRGGWFELGTTNGSAGQTFQVPTNGGGAGTSVAGVQIETSPGSGVYEWYPSLVANGTTGGFITAALSTDARAKYVQYIGGGQVRIGSDGTSNIGFVPASGCKVRVPNVFIRQTSSGARASNTLPNTAISSRSTLIGANTAKSDVENADINLYVNAGSPNVLRLVNCAIEARINVGQTRSTLVLQNTCIGHSVVCTNQGLNITSFVDTGDVTVTGLKLPSIISGNGGTSIAATSTVGLTLSNIDAHFVFNRTTSQSTISFTAGCRNITLSNVRNWGGTVTLTNVDTVSISNIDHIDRMSGNTTATASQYIVTMTGGNANNVTIDGITFGNGGTLSDCQPYGGIVTSNGNVGLVVKNMGTRSAPVSAGSSATFYPNNIYNNTGNDTNTTLKRLYISNTRSAPLNFASSSSNLLFESIYTGSTTNINVIGTNALLKAIFGTVNISSSTKFSTFFSDGFTSNTVGFVNQYAAAPAGSSPFIEYSLLGTSSFSDTGVITFLNGSGSYVIFEMPYFALGHTAFANSAPTITVSNPSVFTFEYQINTGAGYSAWKTLNASNLSGESINPSVGFKLKIRITCNTNASANYTGLRIATVSTLSAQTDNLYPLSTSTLSFTGLQPGTEVRCYTGTSPASAVEIAGVESTAGSTFSFTHANGGTAGYIMIFALGYQPIIIPYTYKTTDDSLLIQQVVDRNYSNPA